VNLSRKASATPPYFYELLSRDDAVVFSAFRNQAEQIQWVATQIHKDITEGELEADDILVIFPEPLTAQSRASSMLHVLAGYRIPAHIVGVTASRDQVFVPGSVAMAHIFRSKGNEALMVYVLNGDDALLETRRISRRNMLFTAITRSRAWVRICGVAPGMDELIDEMKAVVDHNYHLDFKISTEEELQKLNRLGHELPSVYETKIKIHSKYQRGGGAIAKRRSVYRTVAR
jgi:superfamily I DNA and RNA helicase